MLSSDNKKNIQKNIDDYNSKIHDYVNQLNNHEKQILEIKPKIAELTARREENINFLKLYGGSNSEVYHNPSPESDLALKGAKYSILKVIKEGETLSSKEIKDRAKDMGIEAESETINNWLSQLKKEGILESRGHGLYHRPLSSKQVVDVEDKI